MTGCQWHQLNHMQSTCTSHQKITTPAPHHSDFYTPDALPDTQPTASKHWRHSRRKTSAQLPITAILKLWIQLTSFKLWEVYHCRLLAGCRRKPDSLVKRVSWHTYACYWYVIAISCIMLCDLWSYLFYITNYCTTTIVSIQYNIQAAYLSPEDEPGAFFAYQCDIHRTSVSLRKNVIKINSKVTSSQLHLKSLIWCINIHKTTPNTFYRCNEPTLIVL